MFHDLLKITRQSCGKRMKRRTFVLIDGSRCRIIHKSLNISLLCKPVMNASINSLDILLVYKQNIIFDILVDTILLKSVSVINACIVHMILTTCSK